MQFLVHPKTIAELEYDGETCLLRVLRTDELGLYLTSLPHW